MRDAEAGAAGVHARGEVLDQQAARRSGDGGECAEPGRATRRTVGADVARPQPQHGGEDADDQRHGLGDQRDEGEAEQQRECRRPASDQARPAAAARQAEHGGDQHGAQHRGDGVRDAARGPVGGLVGLWADQQERQRRGRGRQQLHGDGDVTSGQTGEPGDEQPQGPEQQGDDDDRIDLQAQRTEPVHPGEQHGVARPPVAVLVEEVNELTDRHGAHVRLVAPVVGGGSHPQATDPEQGQQGCGEPGEKGGGAREDFHFEKQSWGGPARIAK